MSQNYRPEYAVPNVVYIGVPDIRSLDKVLKKLKDNQIPHYRWVEPDDDLSFTAIATIPLSTEQKKVLQNYRLWKVIGEEQRNLLGGSCLTPLPSSPGGVKQPAQL
jgi:hypothetical protein